MIELHRSAPSGANPSQRVGYVDGPRRTRSGEAPAAPRVAADTSISDTLLPDQYFDRLTGGACDTPEKRLMFAVLLDAAIQLQRRNSVGATEAEIWIRGEAGGDGPFSFQRVCEALGLEATYLARGLLAWRGSAARPRVPVRQLRTTHRRVTPSRRRRPAATA